MIVAPYAMQDPEVAMALITRIALAARMGAKSDVWKKVDQKRRPEMRVEEEPTEVALNQ